jgi:hypothetical protein
MGKFGIVKHYFLTKSTHMFSKKSTYILLYKERYYFPYFPVFASIFSFNIL